MTFSKMKITKKLLDEKKFSDMDPAGLAPASPGANAGMLLYTPRARVHESILKHNRPLFQEACCVAPGFDP